MLPYKKTDLRQNKITQPKPDPAQQKPALTDQDELDDILFAPVNEKPAPDKRKENNT
jgi:hypothetical protein